MGNGNSSAIPAWLRRWLHSRPATLSGALGQLNRFRRLATAPGRRLLIAAAVAPAATFVWMVIASAASANAIAQALNHAAIVVAAAALYTAVFVPKRRRIVVEARARSWLVATPCARSARGFAVFAAVAASLFTRWLAAAVLALLASLNAAVTFEQSLTLLWLVTAGGVVGALLGGWLALRGSKPKREGSRYTRRPKPVAFARPSAAALSRWPVAQALAWARPENARLLLLVAILTVPSGIGPIAAVGMLASWAIVSYLGALLLAVPLVARAASDWLRSTPISFWAFAWPIAQRGLLHQLGGTLVGIAVMMVLGAAPATAIYAGTIWLAVVVLVTALSLADCYRARSPFMKITLALIAVLFAEQRAHGWGVSLAVVLTGLHLRGGTRHARA